MAVARVSVIMPAYNAETTIEASLRSLLAQTSHELEVIVVDDGSTDGTAALVERIAEGAPVAVRLVRRSNGGRAAARDTGLAEAAGEYVGFVDADDSVEPVMYDQLLACADETGADVVVCEYLGVGAGSDEVLWRYREGDASLYGGSVVEHPGLLSAIAGSVCNKLIARRLFAEGGIVFPVGRDFEDLATVYRLMGQARRIEKVAEPLYRYRQEQPGSVMGANDARYLQIFDALDITNEYFASIGSSQVLRDDLERINFMHLILGRVTDLLRRGDRQLRHRFIDRAFAHMDRAFPGWRSDAVVRAVCGRRIKHAICTNRALLTLYTDITAKAGR